MQHFGHGATESIQNMLCHAFAMRTDHNQRGILCFRNPPDFLGWYAGRQFNGCIKTLVCQFLLLAEQERFYLWRNEVFSDRPDA